MHPVEFLNELKRLPADTQLNLPQLAAAFEMVSAILHPPKVLPDTVPNGIETEAALAEWLGEPVATIEGWRVRPEFLLYRLSAVLDWINQHIAANVMERLVNLPDNLVDWVPCVIVDGCFVEYFTALNKEAIPTGYELLRAEVLAFEASKIPQVQVMDRAASKAALEEFKREIVKSAERAKKIHEAWKEKAMPDVLLQFFAAALGYDEKLASGIAEGLDEELIKKRFNIGAWLWKRWMEVGFCGIGMEWLRNDSLRPLINKRTEILGSSGRVVFQGSVSHLLADTTGKHTGLPPVENGCIGEYRGTVIDLLDLGMNIDLENSSGLTARGIAEAIEESPFVAAVRSYELKDKITAGSATKQNAAQKSRKQSV